MRREELIREFDVEKRIDELASLIADADVIARSKQQVSEFIADHCNNDCNCVRLAEDFLDALERLQNHLRTLMEVNRNAMANLLISCIASWFTGYSDIVEDTEERLEYFIDELIGEALADFEENIPLFGVRPSSAVERDFYDLAKGVVEQLEEELHGEDIVNEVFSHIRL